MFKNLATINMDYSDYDAKNYKNYFSEFDKLYKKAMDNPSISIDNAPDIDTAKLLLYYCKLKLQETKATSKLIFDNFNKGENNEIDVEQNYSNKDFNTKLDKLIYPTLYEAAIKDNKVTEKIYIITLIYIIHYYPLKILEHIHINMKHFLTSIPEQSTGILNSYNETIDDIVQAISKAAPPLDNGADDGAGIGADDNGADDGAGIGADDIGAGIGADDIGAGIGADDNGAGIGADDGAGIGADDNGAGIGAVGADDNGAGIGADQVDVVGADRQRYESGARAPRNGIAIIPPPTDVDDPFPTINRSQARAPAPTENELIANMLHAQEINGSGSDDDGSGSDDDGSGSDDDGSGSDDDGSGSGSDDESDRNPDGLPPRQSKFKSAVHAAQMIKNEEDYGKRASFIGGSGTIYENIIASDRNTESPYIKYSAKMYYKAVAHFAISLSIDNIEILTSIAEEIKAKLKQLIKNQTVPLEADKVTRLINGFPMLGDEENTIITYFNDLFGNHINFQFKQYIENYIVLGIDLSNKSKAFESDYDYNISISELVKVQPAVQPAVQPPAEPVRTYNPRTVKRYNGLPKEQTLNEALGGKLQRTRKNKKKHKNIDSIINL